MSRKQRIYETLSTILKPQHLTVEDESHRHRVPDGAESHFKVIAVSANFEDLPRIARHRLVNACVKSEFDNGLHALSLHLFTPVEWSKQSSGAPISPPCRSAKNHD